MGMKVCKLVRLTQKDAKGAYVKGKEGAITVRKRAIVSEESVKETEDNYGSSGLLYIIDEKATSKRDEELEAESTKATTTEPVKSAEPSL